MPCKKEEFLSPVQRQWRLKAERCQGWIHLHHLHSISKLCDGTCCPAVRLRCAGRKRLGVGWGGGRSGGAEMQQACLLSSPSAARRISTTFKRMRGTINRLNFHVYQVSAYKHKISSLVMLLVFCFFSLIQIFNRLQRCFVFSAIHRG